MPRVTPNHSGDYQGDSILLLLPKPFNPQRVIGDQLVKAGFEATRESKVPAQTTYFYQRDRMKVTLIVDDVGTNNRVVILASEGSLPVGCLLAC